MFIYTQCPNCGGYKTTKERKLVNRETHEEPLLNDWWLIILSFILGGGLIYSVMGAWAVWSRLFANLHGLADLFMRIGVGLVFLLIAWAFWKGFFWTAIQLYGIATGITLVTMHKYSCHLCGYNWTWEPGEPRPKVTVRPGLIARGEQRLREQEEARQRHLAHIFFQEAWKDTRNNRK